MSEPKSNITKRLRRTYSAMFEADLIRSAMNEAADEISRLSSINAEMLKALQAVEKWWLEEEMANHTGAPYAIFATRTAISSAKRGSR